MRKVICPVCSQEVKPVMFGEGCVWVCCGKVAHSEPRRDKETGRQEENRSRTDDAKV